MPDFHRLMVGDIECIALNEGSRSRSVADEAERYTNASLDDMLAALDAIGGDKDSASSYFNCLYIKSGDTQIVVDVGFGQQDDPAIGQAVPALQAAGIQPEAIGIVFITHFHGDHIAGLVKQDGSPVFPNARYVTMQIEWDHWIALWAKSDLPHHKPLLTMMQGLQDKFSFVNDGDEIASGVTVVHTPGHTPGHGGLLIESNGEQLLDLVDVLHNTAQFERTDWHFKFDTDGALAEQTRKTQLERCANEGTLTLFYHLPFPGLGHVTKAGDAYRWNPIADK